MITKMAIFIRLQSELLAENANLKLQIRTLERQKDEFEQVNREI